MKKIITLTSPDTHGHTTVGVNGDTQKIPHNKRVEVTEEALEVLRNGDLGTAKLVEHDDSEDAEVPASQTVADGLKAGTEASSIQAPATPAATSTEPNPLVDGNGDDAVGGKLPGDSEIGGAPAGSKPEGEQQESSQDSGDDTSAFLDKPIREIDVASLNDKGRIDALIAAEQKRQDPRSTLIEKLEARKAQIGE